VSPDVREPLTLGEVVAAVLDGAGDERLVTPVVVSLLRSGRVRLARAAPSRRRG
jgi:hypothetical protein